MNTMTFNNLSNEAKLLFYEYLSEMNDKNYVDSPIKAMKRNNIKQESFNELANNCFVVPFENGALVINNEYIRKFLLSVIDNKPEKEIKNITKKKYGKYIALYDEEYIKLCNDFGVDYINEVIIRIDEYVSSNGNKNKYKDYNLVIRRAIREKWSILKKVEFVDRTPTPQGNDVIYE